MNQGLIGCALTLALCGGCGASGASEDEGAPSAGAETEASTPPETDETEGRVVEAPPVQAADPTDEGLREALSPALTPGNDGRALALSMRPEPSDFDEVFTEDAAATVRDAVLPLFDDPQAVIEPRSAARTELLIRSATTEELAAEAPAAEQLPGGMTMIAAHLRPGVRWFHAKFVEPGQTSGLSMTAFVYVSGRWVWFPMPWRPLV